LAVQHLRAGAGGLGCGVAGDGEQVHRCLDARRHVGMAFQQGLPARVFVGVQQHQPQALARRGGHGGVDPARETIAGHAALRVDHHGQQAQVALVMGGEAVQDLHHAVRTVRVRIVRAAPAQRDTLRAQFVLAAEVAFKQALLHLAAVGEAGFKRGIQAQEIVGRVAAFVVALGLEERGEQAAGVGRHAPHQQAPGRIGAGVEPGLAQALDGAQHGSVVHGSPSVGPVSS